MFQLILAAVVISTAFYYFAIRPMSYWTRRGVKQGKTHWLVGSNLETIIKTKSFTEMVADVYNAVPGVRYSGMYQLTTPTLVIKDVQLIKQLGVKDFDSFMDHSSFVSAEGDPLWSKNVLALKGQEWREMRPALSPSFTSSKMRTIFVLMSECAENFNKFFLKKDQDSIEIEMRDIFTRYSNDVIATTAFGIKTDSLEEPNNTFYLMGKEAVNVTGFWKSFKFFGYFVIPKVFKFLEMSFFSREISRFFSDIIDDAVKTREEKGIVRPDMIHLLMEARKGNYHKEEKAIDTGFAVVEEADLGKGVLTEMTNIDIAAQALIFFFAGFDTVASLMCSMAYELAINDDIQKKLREEINETLEECGGTLTYDAVLKMKYMDMVVSESLRKWPNVAAVDRICTKPYTIEPATPDEQPIHLEKGAAIWFPIFAIHHDPNIYPDPERFDPERFNDENKEKIAPYTYIPFGVGPRNCIGSRFGILETKVVFFHLLLNFELVPCAKTQIPFKISRKTFNLTAEDGFWFNMKRLKQ